MPMLNIKNAYSPQQALLLFKSCIQNNQPLNFYDAVFTLKSCSFKANSTLVPHIHAHFFKTNLLAKIHVSTVLLNAYSFSSLQDARQLYDEIPNRNLVTSNVMISSFCKHGDLAAARLVFDGLEERDIASCNAMIGGYMNRGDRVSGYCLFHEMMKSGCWKPDRLMLVTLLGGCADTGSHGVVGKSIHCYAERNGIVVNDQLGTKLIDMYTRCGCLRSATRVFDRMQRKNLMHWTAIICGLANHGHGEEAVLYFEAMKKVGVKPNDITFTGVLNACSHAGLVVEAEDYFSSMVEEFGFEPSVHHYGCMADLYARAGRLTDAYHVIEKMKVEPNVVIWTSLLTGCKKYSNFGIAEKVIDQVLGMTIPDNDGGVYTLIADLYGMVGRWNDMERVRLLIDARKVRKSRGSSFIEMEQVSRLGDLVSCIM